MVRMLKTQLSSAALNRSGRLEGEPFLVEQVESEKKEKKQKTTGITKE